MAIEGPQIVPYKSLSAVLDWWRSANGSRGDTVGFKVGTALTQILRITFREVFDLYPSKIPEPFGLTNPEYSLAMPCAFAISLGGPRRSGEQWMLVVYAQSARKIDTVTVVVRQDARRTEWELCNALGMRYETETPGSSRSMSHKYAHAQLTPTVRVSIAKDGGMERVQIDSQVMHRAMCKCEQPGSEACKLRKLPNFDSTPALPIRLHEHEALKPGGEETIFRQLLAAALLASLGCDCEAGDDGVDGCACCGGIPVAECTT